MIVLDGIVKSYAGRRVLDIDRLEIAEGKSVAVIGANGSGKSTLLRILAGTLVADGGTISGLPQSRGYLPQRSYGFGFSVKKNMEISQDVLSAEKARRALESVGLAGFENKKGSRLSGGETQRLAFARIIACERSLLLLDEPTAAADMEGARLIENAIADYKRRCGCTVVFSTHAPAMALRIADEAVFLCEGRVEESGPAERLLKSPASERLSEFLVNWKI